jgi:hypothetical protein
MPNYEEETLNLVYHDLTHESEGSVHLKRPGRRAGWHSAPYWPDSDFVALTSDVEESARAFEGLFGMLSGRIAQLTEQIGHLELRIRQLEGQVADLSDRPSERLVEMSSLFTRDFHLKRPILVNIEEDEDETLARWPTVGVTARGVTEPDAIENLGSAIVDLYVELRDSNPSELGETPLAWFSILTGVVEPSHDAEA